MMFLHLSLPLTLLLLFSFSTDGASFAQAQCLPDQRDALLQLKRGFTTSKLQSWNSTIDCCTWEGVTCDSVTGRVKALELSNRDISGRIDPALFNLSSLENLSLAYNSFYNVTLPEIGFERLSNLTHLNLSNAGFVGQIPIGISQLTNLVLLDLSTFYLNVQSNYFLYLSKPNIKTLLVNLTKLQVLFLDGVNISTNGSQWGLAVSQLGPTLQRLSLSGCSLTGPFDPSLIRLSQISYLNLDQNSLNCPVPEFFANFSYLSVLRLISCLINGKFPERIFQLTNLKEIDLSDNPMLSGHLPEFEKDSSLETLVLSSTNFSGQIPDSIGNLNKLLKFQIYNCSFHGEITPNMQNLVSLSHLDMSWNRFTGEIPKFHEWLGISEYVLNNNNFTGSIPNASYASLFYLSKIDLRCNSLSGNIPTTLFSLPSLQILLLSQNKLFGILPEFSNRLPVLQTIDVSSNNLQGPVPSSIFKLSQLSVLNLASNNFIGKLDEGSIWNLKNLTSLDLSNNMLSIIDGTIGNISLYASFPQIRTLKLVSCNLTKFPSFIRYQSAISILDLSNNKIGGAIPNWVQKIGNQTLTALNLSRNIFTGFEGDNLFLPLVSLEILDLHSNILNGSIPLPPPNIIVFDLSNNFFSLLPTDLTSNIEFTLFLSLSNNSLIGAIPDSICNASYLQVLDLSYNYFTGNLPHCLLNTTLAVLNLKNNKLSGSLPHVISEYCRFRTINLNGNNISGTLPQFLMNCTSLEVLDLGNNKIYGIFPYWLGDLKNLRVLVLRSNKLHGPVSMPISHLGTNDSAFPMLQILDLSSNSFNGTLPKECFKNLNSMINNSKTSASLAVGYKYLDFGGSYYQNSVTVTFKGLEVTFVSTLAMFTSLDFSGNYFEGEIPQEIGELKMLVLLNMSHNALNGTIPTEIGDLQQLESLDLSSNELIGHIPEELTSLTFLSSLNLSHNNLVGKIPQNHQFFTFTNNSFLYNPGLCGEPLTVQCGVPLSEVPVYGTKCSINLNWQFIFTGLGFGAGLAVVFGPLMVWNEWGEQFNKCVDCLLHAVVPLWICSSCINKCVGSDDDEDEPDEMDEEEEDEEAPKFCLFCTQLEIIREKVFIHHVDCSC
ncbi:Receptor-like protein 12 [Rhynchospora pubera]|uniref:Receptor-like protein 12 n=1 Tax=Rhynchospora pubera TaxID=906938 RepID=A0AAV8E260_9POAL|nr:Receptor-like protein 12 [Rhynchospora pubera]